MQGQAANSVEIPVTNLLMGGENGLTGAEFALAVNNPLRPSMPITRSPHVQLLKDYVTLREDIFAPELFLQTAYWENAKLCIYLQGQYFGGTTINDVIERGRRFISRFNGIQLTDTRFGESDPGSVPVVRRVAFSNCFEVTDGKHRMAIDIMRGARSVRCAVLADEPVMTPIQQMVLGSDWTEGHRVVYQPLDLPEFREWPIVRRCRDRLQMMRAFLSSRGPRSGSYLDIGSSYGWFVKQMGALGYQASGIDRDKAAVAVGTIVYGVNPAQITVGDMIEFLSRAGQRFDVVSCFSVLHHFLLGRGGATSPLDFIRLVDSITGSVLFFDTGEAHEDWFKESLKEWNAEYIANWLRENTSFKTVEMLGVDSDNVGIYRTQYGRHLFACYR